MLYINSAILTYKLGDKIFYSKTADRHVLAMSLVQASGILTVMDIEPGEIEQVAQLDTTSSFKHVCGERITVTHRGNVYKCDTLLAYGVPRGLDTTTSVQLTYK